MYTQDELKITARALEYLLANADLSTLERRNAMAALGYTKDFISGDMIMNIWTTDDVKSLVDEDDEADGTSPVTDEEAREVLRNVDRYHDANEGVNWEVLETHLDMVRRDREKQAA
jgi:hypothetical protein